MQSPRPRIAITLGDPNGIGPEVVLKSLLDTRLFKYINPVLVGSADVLTQHANRIGLHDFKFRVVHDASDLDSSPVSLLDISEDIPTSLEVGKITKEAGLLSMRSVEKAVSLCTGNHVDAMVTAPISKEAIALAGYNNKGHSGFIAKTTNTQNYTMMMVADILRVGLVTEHIPLWEVPQHITEKAILEKVRIVSKSLRNDFAIHRPRIAVLGLNPHAGDGGYLGQEEQEIITPAIKQCCQEGHLVFGPFASDGFFAISSYRNYDAVLAMYHDQGLIPFKTLAFGSGVNYTAGLPIIRTSPDHGTAFNIAGQGMASPDSMRSAFIWLEIFSASKQPIHNPSEWHEICSRFYKCTSYTAPCNQP